MVHPTDIDIAESALEAFVEYPPAGMGSSRVTGCCIYPNEILRFISLPVQAGSVAVVKDYCVT
jgi:hypothetical protein